MQPETYIRWFEELRMKDVPLVGGKTASLGELYATLSSKGISVPNGFGITADAYRDALNKADAWSQLRALMEGISQNGVHTLSERAARAREIVYHATGT